MKERAHTTILLDLAQHADPLGFLSVFGEELGAGGEGRRAVGSCEVALQISSLSASDQGELLPCSDQR